MPPRQSHIDVQFTHRPRGRIRRSILTPRGDARHQKRRPQEDSNVPRRSQSWLLIPA